MQIITVQLVGGPFDGAESDVCKDHRPKFIGIAVQGNNRWAVYERGDNYRYNYRFTTTVEPVNVVRHSQSPVEGK